MKMAGRLARVVALTVLMFLTCILGDISNAQPVSPKIDVTVLEALAASRDGTVTIIVHLTEQVDRSLHAILPDAVLFKEDRIALRQDLYNIPTIPMAGDEWMYTQPYATFWKTSTILVVSQEKRVSRLPEGSWRLIILMRYRRLMS